MKIRIYETGNIDLDTVVIMLFQADQQANFHPDSTWILSSSEGVINNLNQSETRLSKRYKELCVKWIGREAVIMWLVSNQVPFEISTFQLLEEELEALEKRYSGEQLNIDENQSYIN